MTPKSNAIQSRRNSPCFTGVAQCPLTVAHIVAAVGVVVGYRGKHDMGAKRGGMGSMGHDLSSLSKVAGTKTMDLGTCPSAHETPTPRNNASHAFSGGSSCCAC